MALEDQPPGTPEEAGPEPEASELPADVWPLLLILPLLLLFPFAYDLVQAWLARVG